jgi:hypothetical protein
MFSKKPKEGTEEQLFELMNMGGFGGLKKKNPLPLEIKPIEEKNLEINSKDEAIRLLTFADKYYRDGWHNLSVQCIAGAIECVLMTLSKHKFNFDYYAEKVKNVEKDILDVFIKEVKRTASYLQAYGNNSQHIFQIAMNGEPEPLVNRFMKNRRMFSMVHSAESFADFNDFIKIGGGYARYRLMSYFSMYEKNFAKVILDDFMTITDKESNDKVVAKHGIHAEKLMQSFATMQNDMEKAVQNNVPYNFGVHVLMFMKNKFKALSVEGGKKELVTVDWFNLKAVYNDKQRLIEPIYDYEGETIYFDLQPIPDGNWKLPSVFVVMHDINSSKELFTCNPNEPKFTVLMQALIPEFDD